ncbi:MAG: hypothetical protein AAGC70_16435 [Pseudomonadota bacterium]
MADKNVVVHSYNLDGETRCVDVFRRSDGTFGFEEYRREPEDGRGWYPIGHHGDRRFTTASDALTQAKVSVDWLAAIVKDA